MTELLTLVDFGARNGAVRKTPTCIRLLNKHIGKIRVARDMFAGYGFL
jgi:hypothetical protein